MNLLEHVHLAVQAVRANWLRGLLTALGVIIGIASLVALTAISAGAQEGVAADLRRLGPNIILLDGEFVTLPGGQQQRVAVARAIVTRPRVLLADEPTGNLDSHSEAEILDMLGAVHANGATIVMVTHAREVAERGTRIVHMLDGLVDLDEALGAAAPVG